MGKDVTTDAAAKAFAGLVEEVRERIDNVQPKLTLDDLEALIWTYGRRLLADLLADLLREVEESLPKPSCPMCSRPMSLKGFRARHLVTLFGVIKVSRRYFVCMPCRVCLTPLDALLQIERTPFTGKVRELIRSLACALPVREVARLLQHVIGIDVAPTSITRHGRRPRTLSVRVERGQPPGRRPGEA